MKTILIIDDDEDILETTGSLLEAEGFAVRSAQTVDRGVEMIAEVQPDLILLDIMFPEEKALGFQAARQIKGNYPHIPIFVLTAINRQYAFDFRKEDIQAEEFLNKPVRIESLVKLINSYI